MLRDGGSAVDAAIAALATACVCEPVLASPGGGGFAMLRDGTSGATRVLDFFPQTPIERRGDPERGFRHIKADFGTATQIFHIGPATAATPGFFAGLEALAAAGARFPLADLFAPAIRAATDGFEVTPYQHYLSTVVAPILTATPAARDLFAPSGRLLGTGEVFRNPGLAEAFRQVGRSGWRGTDLVGQCISQQAADCGHLSEADIVSYRVEERTPLRVEVNGSKVFLNPLPAASGTLIRYALDHLEGSAPVDLAHALDTADVARLAARGNLERLVDRPVRQKGTTHISVVDGDGNACAVTVSNGTGNGDLVDGFGFMLNNILGEEDVNPHGAADWPLNTRLASMMCPTLIETPDGNLIALGSGGSSRIRSAVFQAVARICMGGEGIATAVEAPRLHAEGGHLDVEALFQESDLNRLAETFADHRLWPERNMFFGGVHAVSRSRAGEIGGIGDHRRAGVSLTVTE